MALTAPAPALLPVSSDPVASARAAGLRYVTDDRPGIRRRRAGKHFAYTGPDGRMIRDPDELRRIAALAIPPAWTDVWIAPDPRAHLQATGRDARGRKQYRYHPRWRATRDETKYNRLIAFGEALPTIRARVHEDLRLSGLPRRKVLATVVRLLEQTLIRVGNEEYARANKSFGLTTMRTRHVAVAGATVHFTFRGKSGVTHAIDLSDRRLAGIVKRLQALPGQELFQYVDEGGKRHTIDSADVNAYLTELTGQDFTAKDFRTWAGTVLALTALREFPPFDSETQATHNVVQAIERVAARLGNTPAICRKCYVHPHLLDAYLDGSLAAVLPPSTGAARHEHPAGLTPEETAVLTLLRARLARGAGDQP